MKRLDAGKFIAFLAWFATKFIKTTCSTWGGFVWLTPMLYASATEAYSMSMNFFTHSTKKGRNMASQDPLNTKLQGKNIPTTSVTSFLASSLRKSGTCSTPTGNSGDGRATSASQGAKKGLFSHLCLTDIPTSQPMFDSFFDENDTVDAVKASRPQHVTATAPWDQTIPSGQQQLPVLERIAKGIHDESFPWMISLLPPLLTSSVLESPLPMVGCVVPEMALFAYCMHTWRKLNRPALPQPLLPNRQWRDVREAVWESLPTMKQKREFLMGWFYDEPFENLRQEDALEFLAWMRFGLKADMVDQKQFLDLGDDLRELESNVHYGEPLPLRKEGDKSLSVMRFNLEPLRFRHKPLLFYGITHGAFHLASAALTKNFGFEYVPANGDDIKLGYWYRPAKNPTKKQKNPLVFVHGVGGLAFYYSLISDLTHEIEASGDSTPIILMDLPFVSLRIHEDIPKIDDQVESMCNILDKVAPSQGDPVKATFVGHSFGTVLLSWMVQSKPERVANCVFVDPVCFQLHLKDILFNFHFNRVDQRLSPMEKWSNPFEVGSLINLAGTEMHTNNAMLRQFSWATNALWPQDLVNNNINAAILLSDKDEIVPTAPIADLVEDFNAKQEQKKQEPPSTAGIESLLNGVFSPSSAGNKRPSFVRSTVVEDTKHGEMIFVDNKRKLLVKKIVAMTRLTNMQNAASKPLDNWSFQKPDAIMGKIDFSHVWNPFDEILGFASNTPNMDDVASVGLV